MFIFGTFILGRIQRPFHQSPHFVSVLIEFTRVLAFVCHFRWPHTGTKQIKSSCQSENFNSNVCVKSSSWEARDIGAVMIGNRNQPTIMFDLRFAKIKRLLRFGGSKLGKIIV
jgi:hypothetical protein